MAGAASGRARLRPSASSKVERLPTSGMNGLGRWGREAGHTAVEVISRGVHSLNRVEQRGAGCSLLALLTLLSTTAALLISSQVTTARRTAAAAACRSRTRECQLT